MRARIIETNQIKKPNFWDSWKGRIIRAIVLDGLYTRDKILKRTRLEEEQFEQAFNELFQNQLLTENYEGRFWVNSRELCKEYRAYFNKLQERLVDWVNQWRLHENVESKLNHFYLEDRLLYEFSEKLIENANVEILVSNPFVKKCHISKALKTVSKKGINVELITRSNSEYLKELSENGIFFTYDESAHAKLIVVDRCVGIVSSMNYYAGSTGGELWEAGLVTIEEAVVESIIDAMLKKM